MGEKKTWFDINALSGSLTMGVNVPASYASNGVRLAASYLYALYCCAHVFLSAHHHNLGKLLAFFLSPTAQSLENAQVLKDAVPEHTPSGLSG